MLFGTNILIIISIFNIHVFQILHKIYEAIIYTQ